ncbi:MAG TPA: hypothetical protein VGB50_03560 [Flavobacterium sp.]|jgi:hypothetical protein
MKALRFCFAVLILCLSSGKVHAQDAPAENKLNIALEGMLGVSFSDRAIGINVGGPSLKLRLHNVKIGVGAFPSLLIMDEKAFPRLAVSPIIEYKKLMLIAPYYGYDNADKMIWTFGIGYKFR